jgi:tetratricopeptide (TPR) repeat protein
MATGGVLFTFKHLLIFTLICIPLSGLYVYLVEKIGSALGTFLGWSSKKVSPREVFAADLARARHSKGAGRFEEALSIIDEVLIKDPEFPEALYLKATILWEGFRNRPESTTCLKKVLGLVKSHETLHRWALNYYQDVKNPVLPHEASSKKKPF